MKFFKRQHKSLITAKNNAVTTYKRSALFLVWIAVLALVGNFMGIANDPPSFSFGFASLTALFWSLFTNGLISGPSYILTVLLISFLVGGLFITLGFFAHRAKIIPFTIGFVLYLLDFIVLFTPLYNRVQEGNTNYLITIVIHVFCLIYMIIGLFNYYQVINLSRQISQKVEEINKDNDK